MVGRSFSGKGPTEVGPKRWISVAASAAEVRFSNPKLRILAPIPQAAFSYPLHSRTGSRGYFGNRGSVVESSHRQNTDPRSDSTIRALTQSAHNPTFAR